MNMNFLVSKRLATAAFILLAVCNVTLLGMVLWQHDCPVRLRHGGNQAGLQRAFIESLGLSKSQALLFSKLRQEHFLKVRPEMESITSLKRELVDESLKRDPDLKKIDTLAANIAFHQATIERELAFHFHELGKVCSPVQSDSLKQLLNRIAAHRHAMRIDRWSEHRP
ncbi:MAG: periplasmic heavy metal sensor [Chlorobium sp.]